MPIHLTLASVKSVLMAIHLALHKTHILLGAATVVNPAAHIAADSLVLTTLAFGGTCYLASDLTRDLTREARENIQALIRILEQLVSYCKSLLNNKKLVEFWKCVFDIYAKAFHTRAPEPPQNDVSFDENLQAANEVLKETEMCIKGLKNAFTDQDQALSVCDSGGVEEEH